MSPAPLYIISGERSGDRHGAGLMAELLALHPGLPLHGLGGGEMHSLSPAIHDWVEEAGVVGIVEVIKKYGWFRKKFAQTLAEIKALQPAAVLLIDYPGFNLRLASALKASGYAGRIIYYISPQVWAWHRGRIPQMARILDLMICIFPFEKQIYEGCGLRTEFGGHPLIEYHRARMTHSPRSETLIGLFPGSRTREVARHLPALIAAAQTIAAQHPEIEFILSAASAKLAALMQPLVIAAALPQLRIEVGTSCALMERATCGAVASGTATLEAAIYGLPHCLIYKVNLGTWLAAKWLMKVPYLGIVNIISGKETVKELIQFQCRGDLIAAELLKLAHHPSHRTTLTAALQQVVDGLSGTGAYRQAAHLITAQLK